MLFKNHYNYCFQSYKFLVMNFSLSTFDVGFMDESECVKRVVNGIAYQYS